SVSDARGRMREPATRPAGGTGDAHRRRARADQRRLPGAPLRRSLRSVGPVPEPRHRRRDPARAPHTRRRLAAGDRPLSPAGRRRTGRALSQQCPSTPGACAGQSDAGRRIEKEPPAMKRRLHALPLLSLLVLSAHAAGQALVIVEDRGGVSALPYYQALDLPPQGARQAVPSPRTEGPSPPTTRHSEADMLPVRSPSLT